MKQLKPYILLGILIVAVLVGISFLVDRTGQEEATFPEYVEGQLEAEQPPYWTPQKGKDKG